MHYPWDDIHIQATKEVFNSSCITCVVKNVVALDVGASRICHSLSFIPKISYIHKIKKEEKKSYHANTG
jgi:hypothetical protein